MTMSKGVWCLPARTTAAISVGIGSSCSCASSSRGAGRWLDEREISFELLIQQRESFFAGLYRLLRLFLLRKLQERISLFKQYRGKTVSKWALRRH